MGAFEKLVRRTPLVQAPALAERLGVPGLWLKLENLQRTGSFKIRGACRKLDALAPGERARGVVAASAGNHGMGVALAGQALGIRVKVFVPETSPDVKREGIVRAGAEVIVAGATYDEAEARARAHAEEAGAVFVSPFDDPDVIEGNGASLAREILEQLPSVKHVIFPVGGGGLGAGLASVLAPAGVALTGVEPAGNCAMRDSLAQGKPLTTYPGGGTIAEGLEGAICARTYQAFRDHRVSVVTVPDAALEESISLAYHLAGQVIEPSAAAAPAALLTRALDPSSPTLALLTGSNTRV